jgi:hypothetical protein
MQVSESAAVKEWRRVLIRTREILELDGRTKEAKRWKAQRQLLLATASDEELYQMARMSADMFDYPYEQVLNDLRNDREQHKNTVKSWRGNLAKFQK